MKQRVIRTVLSKELVQETTGNFFRHYFWRIRGTDLVSPSFSTEALAQEALVLGKVPFECFHQRQERES